MSAAPRRSGARSQARRLAMQGLYQYQITGHDGDEILRQLADATGFDKADRDYLAELIHGVLSGQKALDDSIGLHADRPVAQLDPIERAILWIGTYELKFRDDVPFKVIINEAINLSRRFGADKSHKYINAVLDRAAGMERGGRSPDTKARVP